MRTAMLSELNAIPSSPIHGRLEYRHPSGER